MSGGLLLSFVSIPWIYISVALGVITLLIHHFLNQRKSVRHAAKNHPTIPGPPPSDPELGNMLDISKAGSIHEYLSPLHKQYGPIVSFLMGKTLTISIASPGLFKQGAKLFSKPLELFKDFEPWLTKYSLGLQSDKEARVRHAAYSCCYSVGTLKKYFDLFQEIAEELVSKWMVASSDKKDIEEEMYSVAIKAISRGSFGSFFNSDEEIDAYYHTHMSMWKEHELQLIEGPAEPGSERDQRYKQSIAVIHDTVRRAINHRKKSPGTGDPLLIDVIMDIAENDDVMLGDAVYFLWGGFHTSALLMTWTLYYLAKHPEYQQKVYEEMCEVMGDGNIDGDNIQKLVYTRQVLDETLRCSTLATFAGRFSEVDLKLDGHIVPAKTPIFFAMSVMAFDEKLWPDPMRFDPDRFSPTCKKLIPDYTFEPFGFAGKRKCPGSNFALMEVTTVLSVLLRKFEMSLVEEDNGHIAIFYSILTRPKEKLFLRAKKRVLNK